MIKTIVIVVSLVLLVPITATYKKWSRKAWAERCEINALHPDWTPACGRNFFKEDPDWFVQNGYENYLKEVGYLK